MGISREALKKESSKRKQDATALPENEPEPARYEICTRTCTRTDSEASYGPFSGKASFGPNLKYVRVRVRVQICKINRITSL